MFNPVDLKTRLIQHIIMMKTYDKDYAREALKSYDAQLPELELMEAVRQALK